jgi:hypothetical protein
MRHITNVKLSDVVDEEVVVCLKLSLGKLRKEKAFDDGGFC